MGEEVKKEETEAASEEAKGEKKAEENPLDKMTAPELREIAKDIPGVTGVHAMKKDELVALIKGFRGIKDEEPVKKTKTSKPARSSKDLKLKIVQLRAEKEKALKAKDRKHINILRRRINRLKKMRRKIAQA